MKVSISWLKELVDLNCSIDELVNLLPLRSISIKEVTDAYIELDMKGYNRADLLSMRGVAYEVAAITGSKLSFGEPNEAEFVWNTDNLPSSKVEVQNPRLAPFYTITKIVNLKVQKSPDDWIKRLEECGMRSVDNITDITNLIMLEYGQPMHAFDIRAVRDESIIVRTAKKGERITTLDGKTRDLETSDLLITDSLNALGIAGVMGGKDSEVTDSTNTILLEAAIFDPVNIRKTATRLALPSEASKRFQHGLTRRRLLQALDAAIKMYESLGGKLTALTIAIAGELEDPIRKVKLTQEKIDSLIGAEIKSEEVEAYLKKLGFSLASQGQALRAWEVTVPYFRLDIELEEDVIEEVARMYGYEKIPASPVSESNPLQKESPLFNTISDLKHQLVDLGLTEVQTYSFYSTKILQALGLNDKNEALVKIANPISSETEYLRDNLWPNLVEVVDRNFRKGYKQSLPSGDGKDMAIFELGKTYQDDENGNPKEGYTLAIALCNESENPLAELYQIVQNTLDTLGVKLVHPGGVQPLYHPKRLLAIQKDGKQIGILAEVHLRILNKLGIEKRVAVLEISIEQQ